ncbi:UDP-glucose dehydrogenase family protein [Flexilinea flocculi]|jgi:UDPglucose 6-dehydrogenase|uniref:UDP-glucose 6-dehydrogenase n=1 Tax=Flexilinea flocculi TaxID=1678840 RepID=A0A0S7BJI5_9CHLR|nr:UDP-glucose/GDP-mannose dehydrogenase family protein [Flexilinea flocculi]NMB93265.1 UDP-glucose/GDP-mannose dehydrogenase family protein [Flexilinea flocculi]GAP40517.1 UDP-glucose dehydrogenase [Flexilinea flocculi]
MSKITVIGTGYVGLVTGACFADLGNTVMCLDIDQKRIDGLHKGIMPIYEPGLEEIVERAYRAKRIDFTTDYAAALQSAEYVFIAVGTPSGENGEADMQYVEKAVKKIAETIDHSFILVDKSTVPVGTGDWAAKILQERFAETEIKFSIVSNPEFLKEGTAINDFMRPDRIVLGSNNRAASEKIAELYESLRCPILITDIRTAEMIKYASNAFLAAKISFINEIANICERVGANVVDVAKGMGLDSRIGPKFLNAGIGWGGSCFPKDVKALVHIAQEFGTQPQLLQAVIEINKYQRKHVVQKFEEIFGDIKGKRIGILGLAFKPDTDDIRESPAVDIIKYLTQKGAIISAYDPAAMELSKLVLPKEVSLYENPYQVVEGTDALLLATEWNEFKQLDFEKIHQLMHGNVILDGRNLWDPQSLTDLGFRYYGIGLGQYK